MISFFFLNDICTLKKKKEYGNAFLFFKEKKNLPKSIVRQVITKSSNNWVKVIMLFNRVPKIKRAGKRKGSSRNGIINLVK